MDNLNNLTFINMIKGWNDNQDVIRDYLQNREGYEDNNSNGGATTILGLSAGFFIILFLVSIFLFIYSIYLLVVNWNVLPTWAKVIGLIGLFFFPLVTIIVVLVGKAETQGGLRQGGVGYSMYGMHKGYSMKGGYGMHNMHAHNRYHIRRRYL